MFDWLTYENGAIAFNTKNLLIMLAFSLVLGGLISFVYKFTNRKTAYNPSFIITVLVLPVIIAIVILLMTNNLAAAISSISIFTLVRFRSEPEDPANLVYILICVAVGVAVGLGQLLYALIIGIVLSLILLIVYFVKASRRGYLKLKIIIPESINFTNLFDDLFVKYQLTYRLEKVRTTDFGACFELDFIIRESKEIDEKAFIDEIRCRNGNLNVQITYN